MIKIRYFFGMARNYFTPHKRLARKLRRVSAFAGSCGFYQAMEQYNSDANKIEMSE